MVANNNVTGTDIVADVLPVLECGTDFFPGIFCLKMLTYSIPTARTVFSRKYPIAAGATVGRFIDSILDRHMDQFLFELYTYLDAQKGCGHFAVRAYQVWLEDNLITDANSIEAPHHTFPVDIIATYLPDGRSTEPSVGLGRFLHLSDPTIDEPNVLVPQYIWSVAETRSSRVLAGRDAAAENAAAYEAAQMAQEAEAAQAA
ncbi:hypothetical protein F5148DRAFT_1161305 [Russula earlei]|uniref:Uncharacterized protein n=1 Tax=Russula earlei TaxID=71964 RepID=A0ACC0UM78_9AGAM|nr:hypothetical protein F5148DRAFT_1161305 [Russula earlei]